MRDTAVVSKATTTGVLNDNSDIHPNTKSHQATIHTNVSLARGAEKFDTADCSFDLV